MGGRKLKHGAFLCTGERVLPDGHMTTGRLLLQRQITAAPGSSHTARVRAPGGRAARPGCRPRRGWGTSQTLQAPHRPQTKGSIYLPPEDRAPPVLPGGAPRHRPGPARSGAAGAQARHGPARPGPSSPPRCCRAAGPRPAAKLSRPPRETAPRHQGSCRRRPPSREPRRSGRPGQSCPSGAGSRGCPSGLAPALVTARERLGGHRLCQ